MNSCARSLPAFAGVVLALACQSGDTTADGSAGSEVTSSTDAVTASTSEDSGDEIDTSASETTTSASGSTGESSSGSDGSTTGPAECGNGAPEPGEGCDDANLVDDDGCDADCQPSAVVSASAGHDLTCAVLRTGSVRCWGRNDLGYLGYGHTEYIGDDEHPKDAGTIDVGEAALAIESAAHTCATLDGGRIRCWGRNEHGELGYGNIEVIGDDEVPAAAGDVAVGGLVARIDASFTHACAVLEGGAVRCWGRESALGYGLPPTENVGDDETPAEMGDLDVGGIAIQIVAGNVHSCALLEGGAVRCWGDGADGVLGYGNSQGFDLPSDAPEVEIGGAVVQLAAGKAHTCALLEGGAVRCWGEGVGGRLGYGSDQNVGDNETPADLGDVEVGGPVEAIAAGQLHTCALMAGGTVRCWGEGGIIGLGDLVTIGDDELPSSAGEVDVGGTVVQISTLRTHTCAVLEGGSLRCWGTNAYGQLGYASTEDVGDDETPASAGDVQVF